MTEAGAAPLLHAWHAPDHWRAIDFVSDLHLSPALPRTLQAFARHLEHTDADAVCLLGDVFELWVGDDARDQPFERSVAGILASAATRVSLHFMPGNRDFLVGEAMCRASGLTPLPDPVCLHAWGRRWVLCHGDAQCLGDAAYQAFRQTVRSPPWQSSFLARSLHERLDMARQMRTASQARRMQVAEGLGDLDPDACASLLRTAGASTLIHGHTHRPAQHALGAGLERWVLSDWDLDTPGGPDRAEVLRLRNDGSLTRLPPAGLVVQGT